MQTSKGIIRVVVFSVIWLFGVVHAMAQTVQWAKSPNSSKSNSGSCLITDNAGNIYLGGTLTYPDSIYFDSQLLTIVSGQSGYLAKFDASGNAQWAVKSARANSLATDNNAIYTIAATNPNTGNNHIMLAKYDLSGNELWYKSTTGANGGNKGNAIVADQNGGLFFAGRIGTNVTFDTVVYTRPYADREAYLTRYDTSGAVQWLVKAYGPGDDEANAVAFDDASGSCYFTGKFEDSLYVGNNKAASAGGEDIFIAKVDASGNPLWLKSAGGTGADEALGMGTDAAGNVYIAGMIFGNTNFGSINAAGSGRNMFVAKYDASGNEQWVAVSAGGSYFSTLNAMTVSGTGNIWITGLLGNTVTFTGSSLSLSPAGGSDVFVARLDNAGNWLWAEKYGDTGNEDAASITLTPQKNILITGSAGRADNGPGTTVFGGQTLTIGNMNDILLAELADGSSGIAGPDSPESPLMYLYPNPASSQIIRIAGKDMTGNHLVRLYDVAGSKVLEVWMNTASHIQLQKSLTAGMYLYTIQDDNGSYTGSGKLIVE